MADTLDLVRQETQNQIQWAAMSVSVRVRPVLQRFDSIVTNKQRRVRCPNIGNLETRGSVT